MGLPATAVTPLRVGLVNLLPDAALRATERQFVRLVQAALGPHPVEVLRTTLPGLDRGPDVTEALAARYLPVDQLLDACPDALIVTGTNVAVTDVSAHPVFPEMARVFEWAEARQVPLLTSCLASHAWLQSRRGTVRTALPDKRWGVYAHRVTRRVHPLTRQLPPTFDAPHSRHNTVPRREWEAAGLMVVVTTTDGEVHAAASADGARIVCLQGHPEYDTASLLKEYAREWQRAAAGEREVPPMPRGYLSAEAERRMTAFCVQATLARDCGRPLPPFPEDEVVPLLRNTWREPARIFFRNWLDRVARRP
jgi:homoserine O-succinyltransferase